MRTGGEMEPSGRGDERGDARERPVPLPLIGS